MFLIYSIVLRMFLKVVLNIPEKCGLNICDIRRYAES